MNLVRMGTRLEHLLQSIVITTQKGRNLALFALVAMNVAFASSEALLISRGSCCPCRSCTGNRVFICSRGVLFSNQVQDKAGR